MAKKNKSKSKKQKPVEEEERVSSTLAAVEAMSSDDEEGGADDDEMNAEAAALRQAIADGAFDGLLQQGDGENDEDEEQNDDDDANGSESHDDDESDSDEEQVVVKSQKALAAVLEEMTASRRGMPWAETFDVIPDVPLPFAANPLDVHDDLKREVAFYNLALDAVKEARNQCNDTGVPFSRPDDFFAEMVKTDGKSFDTRTCTALASTITHLISPSSLTTDHMAKVKDRLIFETKKMDAVAQRKSNKEQKLRSKEKKANKLAEKAKRKKDHFQQVDEWAKAAASNRGGALADDDDDQFLRSNSNKKRMAADKKYGYGGKRGRFKQNDPRSLNDMSGFNPRGNFSGGSKKGSGANRKGKRARDAARSRR